MDGVVEDDGGITLEYLEPSSYPQNGKARWKDSGRTMAVAANPVGGEVAAWATKRASSFRKHGLKVMLIPSRLDQIPTRHLH